MPYNSYFPVNYQPYSQPQTTSSIIWVQGEAGAKAYPVAAGNSMLLMDSESEQFYIKSTDVSGMPMPLRVFSYKEIQFNPSEPSSNERIDMSMYITRDELESRLNALKTASNKKVKKEEAEDE